MPIRLEFTPIKTYGLGVLGFDHLLLVHQNDLTNNEVQDNWFVVEGLKGKVWLEAEGLDGTTTLSDANDERTGAALEEYLGTPASRGSRILPIIDSQTAWSTIVTYANDLDAQFPYVVLGLPGTVRPTSNSTSLIASLLYYLELDISLVLPFGLRSTSGLHTLLGTQSDDELETTDNFTTVQAGKGDDTLTGTMSSEKFFGGAGNDTIHWSGGVDVIHGGQYKMAYKADGTDTVNVTGIGDVIIRRGMFDAEGYAPDFLLVKTGFDVAHLYSIERIDWSPATDRFFLEEVKVLEDGLLLKMGGEDTVQGDRVEFAALTEGLLINATSDEQMFVQVAASPDPDKGSWIEAVEWIHASSGNDKIYAAGAVTTVEAGIGNDLIDVRELAGFSGLSPNGYDIEILGGAGQDTLVGGAGRMLMNGGEGADMFVIGAMREATFPQSVEIVIDGADASDKLYIPYAYFDGTGGPYEGSPLLQIKGGFGSFADMQTYGDLSRFEWLREEDQWYGDDEREGIINFTGGIYYLADGADLMIYIYQGTTYQTIVDPGTANEREVTMIAPTGSTETIVRVKDYDDGDLGVSFYSPGDPTVVEIPGLGLVYHWSEHNNVVELLTNNGQMTAPLDPRPVSKSWEQHQDESQSAPTEGTSGNDLISSIGSGDQLMFGNAGEDTLVGDAGDDVLDGGTGIDSMDGGAGNDTYYVDDVADVIFESADGGTDTIFSDVDMTLGANLENLVLSDYSLFGGGNEAANVISGGLGNDTLMSWAGDDLIVGGPGSDTLDGGVGSDRYGYSLGDGDDFIDETGSLTDTDILIFNFGIDPADVTFYQALEGFPDVALWLSDGSRILLEGFYDPAQSIDEILFADGTHWLRSDLEAFAAAAPQEVNAAPLAIDDAYGVTRMLTIFAPEAFIDNDTDKDNDPLTVTAVSNAVNGSVFLNDDGTITFIAQYGFEGAASFTYTVSDDQGNDATGHADIAVMVDDWSTGPVDGTTGADLLIGSGERDLIRGEDGDDTLEGGAGADTLDGGSGVDTVSFAGATEGITLRLDGSGTNTGDAVGDTLVSIEAVVGSAFGDTIVGSVAADVLAGAGGDDSLMGGEGSDQLSGGEGADTLDGGPGNDLLDGFSDETSAAGDLLRGDAGDDTYIVGAGDVIYEVDPWSTDTAHAMADHTLSVAAAIEHLIAASADVQVLVGNALAQTIGVATGQSIELHGRDGNDTITGAGGEDTLAGDEGNDQLFGADGNDWLAGGDGQDWLDGGAGADTLIGGAGNDTLLGRAGGDLMEGGAGDDFYKIDDAADQVVEQSGEGTDFVAIEIDGYTLADNVENARLDAPAASATGNALANDITGNDLANVIDGGGGADTLKGQAGSDSLIGADGNDALYGGADVDTLVGGAGNDVMNGGEGADDMDGGDGDDVYWVDHAADTISDSAGLDTLFTSATYQVAAGAHIEYLRVAAGATDVTLTGNDFGAYIIGSAGSDTLVGGAGVDRITTNGGVDRVVGGAGNDIYYIDHTDTVVVELMGEGQDNVYAASDWTAAAGQSIEILRANAGATGLALTGNDLGMWIYGAAGSDTLTGGAAGDILDGGVGADIMSGGEGNDTYYVDNVNDVVTAETGGVDTIYARAEVTLLAGQEIEYIRISGSTGVKVTGSDLGQWLTGDSGNDTIDGAGGDDILYGAGGADVFVFQDNWAVDRVTDFQQGVDMIDLSAVSGLTGFEELQIAQSGTSATVSFGGNTIIMFNTAVADLTSVDFIF